MSRSALASGLLATALLKSVLFVPLLLMPENGRALSATISVNTASVVNTFIPIHMFGNNASWSNNNTGFIAVGPQMQAAGTYFLRYPGGSYSNQYHWNGTGSYDSNGYWVPSATSYSAGFRARPTHPGSSRSEVSNLVDGNTSTYWLSNVDTANPNHQWIEMDLAATGMSGRNSGTVKQFNSATIAWGTPYAASFRLQYWTGPNTCTPHYCGSSESYWSTIGKRLLGVPNPNPSRVYFELAGRADKIHLKIYTTGMLFISEIQGGPASPGWNFLALDPAFQALTAGTYFARLVAIRSGMPSQAGAPVAKLVLFH